MHHPVAGRVKYHSTITHSIPYRETLMPVEQQAKKTGADVPSAPGGPYPMSELVFADALQQELRSRGVAFDPGEVNEFVEDVWARFKAAPQIARWADEYLSPPRSSSR